MTLRSTIFSLASLALFGLALDAAPNPRVQFTTNLGSFTVELDAKAAPKTVENFLGYVNSGFYAETTFHRVIKTFMVQGGGHTVDGTQKPTNAPVVNEAQHAIERGLKNVRGSIAMARTSDPHSATSQFFINVVDNAFLDYPGRDGAGYCVFGRVVEGMATVDKIRDVTTLPGDRPSEPVLITEAKLLPAKTAKKQSK
jgi:peptidyl-prolyl cis-trans isomerase A (cyclophilin A)